MSEGSDSDEDQDGPGEVDRGRARKRKSPRLANKTVPKLNSNEHRMLNGDASGQGISQSLRQQQHDAQLIKHAANQYVERGYDDRDGPNFQNMNTDDGKDRRGRKENGLVELTKKFIDLLK